MGGGGTTSSQNALPASSNTLTANSFTSVSLSSWVPAISTLSYIQASAYGKNTANTGYVTINQDGSSTKGLILPCFPSSGDGDASTAYTYMPTSSTQTIQYEISTTNINCTIAVAGYVVTGVS